MFGSSISGTSSGKEKAVVASLSCSPDGRCSSVNVNNLNILYVVIVSGNSRTITYHHHRPPTKYGNASFTCANVVLSGNAADLFGTCSTT